jgi:Cof subfamily protein (haloacid dehalogenase superfamily)
MSEQTNTKARRVSLVVSDVDGTLVTEEKVLTPRACAAVRKLYEAGITLALTSGRPPLGMQMLIEPLRLTGPIAAFNGGIFVRPDMSVIEQHFLPSDVARGVIQALESRHVETWVYDDRAWYVRTREAPHVAREAATVKFPPTVVPDFEHAVEKVTKIVGVSDNHDALAQAEADVQQFAGLVSAARSQPYYLDVTDPQANKGAVIDTLSRMLAIPASEVVSIGDGPNDVLMFEKSGLSIAMANASEDVQKAAHCVTTSYDQEGFANAMERFVLSNSRANRA